MILYFLIVTKRPLSIEPQSSEIILKTLGNLNTFLNFVVRNKVCNFQKGWGRLFFTNSLIKFISLLKLLKMKKQHALSIFIILIINTLCLPLFSQSVTYTAVGGNCAGTYTLALGPIVNGKNSYSGSGAIVGTSTIFWTGTQWVISNSLAGVLFTNGTETAINPPCHTLGTFTAVGVCVGGVASNSSGNCTNTPIPVELYCAPKTGHKKGKKIIEKNNYLCKNSAK